MGATSIRSTGPPTRTLPPTISSCRWSPGAITSDFAEWQALLDRFERDAVPVANPVPVLRWNGDKSYLAELDGRASRPFRRSPFEAFGMPRSKKRAALRQRLSWSSSRPSRRALTAPSGSAPATRFPSRSAAGAMLVQPLLEEIVSSGEFSLIFFDGEFSHSVASVPKRRRFPRTAAIMAASSAAATPPPGAIELAQAALAAAPARGDLRAGRHRLGRRRRAAGHRARADRAGPVPRRCARRRRRLRRSRFVSREAPDANSHWRIADVRFGGRAASSRATSICATSALIGIPRSRAAASSARQNMGSRLIEVSWPAISTDLFFGGA